MSAPESSLGPGAGPVPLGSLPPAANAQAWRRADTPARRTAEMPAPRSRPIPGIQRFMEPVGTLRQDLVLGQPLCGS